MPKQQPKTGCPPGARFFDSKRLVTRSTFCIQLVLILLFLLPGALAAANAVDEYRSTLLELFDTAGEILYFIDPDTAEGIAEATVLFDTLSDEEIRSVFMESLTIEALEVHIQTLQPHLSEVRQLGQSDEIVIPELLVNPPACLSVTEAAVFIAATVRTVAELAVASEKFVCLTEEGGANDSLACAPINLIRATASLAAEGAEFCLAMQNLAREIAAFQLTNNIASHLNDFVDDTTLSSRATQQTLDSAQSDLDDVQSNTLNIQSALDSGYAQLNSQAASLFADISGLDNDLGALGALLDDINFRSSVNLAFLEDASVRVADLQQRAGEIQSDVATITGVVGDVNSASTLLNEMLDAEWNRQQLDRIAADLGNTQAGNPAHALPASAGGKLELAREVVINSIFLFQALGTVDTSVALMLVAKADVNYNGGHYRQAYRQLKQAYQSLDALGEER